MLNGRLDPSLLTPIPGRAMMRKDAAARLKAENARLRARGRGPVMANGTMSGYRSLVGQVIMRRSWCARGACQNAAIPGTSNHGWGIALDSNQAWELDGHDGPFDRSHSDAPWEAWHRRCNVPQTSMASFPPEDPILRKGTTQRAAVVRLQRLLHSRNLYKGPMDGVYGLSTRRAVRRFQKAHHLTVDSVVGASTWRALRSVAK